MKTSRLRAILTRYGNTGVLVVGAYMVLHHTWHRRRAALLLVSTGLVLTLAGAMLLRPAPVRKLPPRTLTQPVVPAPPPPVARLHLSLQDDTAPVPFPAAAGNAPLRSDGLIYFSANFYRWSGQFYTSEYGGDKEETLATDAETCHLFCLAAGMRHPRQLTFGAGDDRNPTLSPDGRQLAFIRQSGEQCSLCLVSTRGGAVRTLRRLPHSDTGEQLNWSPNGRWFSVGFGSRFGVRDADNLLLFRPDHRGATSLHGIKEATWSPEGRLYLRETSGAARVFDPETRSNVPLKATLKNVAWLDAHTLIGDVPADEETVESSGILRIIDNRGRQIRQLSLNLVGAENDYGTFDNEHRWHCLPHHSNTVLLETWRSMSDGEHYGCFRVDLRTGQARLVADGTLIGIAPDGSRIAVAENAWVGPYKRGGARVGPLKVVSLATGRADSVTDPLSCLSEGTWQQVSAHTSDSHHVAPLLAAVSTGDLKAVRTLLREGANPNISEPNRVTALMIAASDGRVEMVRLLLQHGARVNPADPNGNTALLHAIDAEKMSNEVPTSAQIAVAEMLIQAGAQINASNHHGDTALMLAAGEGRAVVADWLVQHGATPNAYSKRGWTALMLAASSGYSHTVQVLLDAHAALNVKNKEEETVLEMVQPSSNNNDPATETVTLLKQAGATERTKP